MRAALTFGILRLAMLLSLLGISLVGMPGTAVAQGQPLVDDECFEFESFCDVEGIAAILPSTNSAEIDTYVATSINDFTLLDEFQAYVEGTLFDNDSQVDFTSGFDDGSGLAEASMSDPVVPADVYEVDGYHEIDDFFTGDTFPMGDTAVAVYTGPPRINSFSPTYGFVGTTGTITAQGIGLFDPFSGTVEASFGSGSGLQLIPQSASPDGTELILEYIIAQNATTGPVNIVLSDRFGIFTSTQTFNVGDPPPIITSVSPSVWQAGTSNLAITINGSGFGTNPSVSVSGTGVALLSVGAKSDTQISANVSIASNAPNGTAQVQVQSTGDNGSGFLQAFPGEPSTSSYTVTVDAILAPVPQIQLYGNTITMSQSVFVGQEIALSALVNLPPGISICGQSWSTPPGTAVGGYLPSNSSASVMPLPALSSSACTTTPLSISFYWVDAANSREITYSYTNSNGTSNSATATFNVAGPTGASVAVNIGKATVEPITNNSLDPNGTPTLLLWGVQVPGGNETGIMFQASATPPSGNTGAYSWVQLVNSDVLNQEGNFFRGACTGGPSASNPQLDLSYPYSTTMSSQNAVIPDDIATDNPEYVLKQVWGEAARHFTATMYLMWTPTAASACPTGGSGPCTIPVPLGSVNVSMPWNFSGDTINTLSTEKGVNGTTWMMNYDGQPSTPSFQGSQPDTDSNNGFPTWGSPSPYKKNAQTCPL